MWLDLRGNHASDSAGPRFTLSKRVSIGYTRDMKDSGLRIRVQRDLRDRFLEVCRAQDKPAAQVIREFMRDYVERQDRTQESPAKRQERSKARTAQ